ncbi:hypothetical protein AX15_001701 [Amanita polypyramis BW_CC]|nr:hypothetical protein AX15_001701 [Amanita polypyramis BW_CC]
MPRRASFPPPVSLRLPNVGSLLNVSGMDPSLAKRKWPARENVLDVLNKLPRNDRATEGKETTVEGVRRAERAVSESLVSVTSHIRQARLRFRMPVVHLLQAEPGSVSVHPPTQITAMAEVVFGCGCDVAATSVPSQSKRRPRLRLPAIRQLVVLLTPRRSQEERQLVSILRR